MLGQAPLADELVSDTDDVWTIAYSFTGQASDAFCEIAVSSRWVDLRFRRGSEIPDPERRLDGTTGTARHIRIETLDDLREPHVGRFLRAAMRGAARGKERA